MCNMLNLAVKCAILQLFSALKTGYSLIVFIITITPKISSEEIINKAKKFKKTQYFIQIKEVFFKEENTKLIT